ncbi:uncharacterized protein LOC135396191 [Ornithodoros turicata]|uniref:uncharacterized protein LOC135396191 n=1 Tax=Ornithodoros turicata TaxID=34597 RepID=UPI003138BFED
MEEVRHSERADKVSWSTYCSIFLYVLSGVVAASMIAIGTSQTCHSNDFIRLYIIVSGITTLALMFWLKIMEGAGRCWNLFWLNVVLLFFAGWTIAGAVCVFGNLVHDCNSLIYRSAQFCAGYSIFFTILVCYIYGKAMEE